MTNKIIKIGAIAIKTSLALVLLLVGATVITSNTGVLGGIRSFTIGSGSMEPNIPVGSVIFTKPAQAYELDDVVVFEAGDGKTVAHRITQSMVAEGEVKFKTKGDANNAVDLETVAKSKIKGSWFLTVPYVGNLAQSLKTPLGFGILVATPAAIFIGFEVLNIKREMEKEIEKKVRRDLEVAA